MAGKQVITHDTLRIPALLKRGSRTFTIYRWFSHLDPPLIGGFPARFDCLPGIPRTMELFNLQFPPIKKEHQYSVIIYLLGFHPPEEKKYKHEWPWIMFFLFNHHPKTGNINPLSLWPVARPTPTLRLPGTVRQNQHGSSGQEQWNWLRGSSLLGRRWCIQHGTRQFGPPKKMTYPLVI